MQLDFYLETGSTRNLNTDEFIFNTYEDQNYIKKLRKTNRAVIYARSNYGMCLGAIIISKNLRALKINLMIVHKCFRRYKVGNELIKTIISIFNDDFMSADILYTVCPHNLITNEYQELLLKNGFQLTTIKANGDLIYTYAKSIQKSSR